MIVLLTFAILIRVETNAFLDMLLEKAQAWYEPYDTFTVDALCVRV